MTPLTLDTPVLGGWRGTTPDLVMHCPKSVWGYAEKAALAYVAYGADFGIRADFLFAQACFETDFFRFTGRVKANQHNPCGLRLPDGSGFYSFPSIEDGVLAHVAHVAAYVLPEHTDLCRRDPKHPDKHWNNVRVVADFAGKWAPTPDYARNLIKRWEDGA